VNTPFSIVSHIERSIGLSVKEKAALDAIVSRRRVSKREEIVSVGRRCTHQTYMVKGAARSFFTTPDGNEHTIQFAIEDWFISDFSSYLSQSPASLCVETVEESTIEQISYHDTEALCATHPKFERHFRVVAQKAFAFSQRRVLSNIGLTAEERYTEFEQLYPAIVERIPQYMLASYLGMTPEFLSRIRRKRVN